MLFKGNEQAAPPKQKIEKHEAANQNPKADSPNAELTGSTWLTKDAAGFFTAGLVLIGISQAILFYVQLLYMRKSMDDTKSVAEAARVSAMAATRSADVVYNQLKIALDSAIKAERGLLVTDDWQIVGFGPRERPTISCILRNTGRSPNYITQGMYDYSVANELPTAFDIFEQPILPLPGIIRQTTGSVIVINDLPELSETEYYDRLAEGGASLYLRIRLRYRDVTGGRYEIITTAKYGITADRDGERLFGFEFPEEQKLEEDWPRDAGEFADSRQYNNHRSIDTGDRANPRAHHS